MVHIDDKNVPILLENFDITATIDIDRTISTHLIKIDKKTDDHNVIRLQAIFVNGIALPQWLLHDQGVFSWHNNQHKGSMIWYPAGTWQFCFDTPLLTWILDQKILHETKYNQDYLYPWSYKLGPDSVSRIGGKIDRILEKINLTL